MQDPLLHTFPEPEPANQANQAIDRDVPTIGRGRLGWYPRWWILAAFLCSIIIVIGLLVWQPLLCPDQGNGTAPALICHITSWVSPVHVALIWLLLLACWFVAALGFNLVEVPRAERSTVGEILRSLSEFGPLHTMLLIQGGVALVIINIMWWLDNSPPIAFTFLSIVVFLANCSLFQRMAPAARRLSLIGYGIVSLGCLVVEVLLKPNFLFPLFHAPPQEVWPLVCTQVLLIFVGIGAIFWRPRDTTQLTARQAMTRNVRRFDSPFAALASVWPFNRIFTPRP